MPLFGTVAFERKGRRVVGAVVLPLVLTVFGSLPITNDPGWQDAVGNSVSVPDAVAFWWPCGNHAQDAQRNGQGLCASHC